MNIKTIAVWLVVLWAGFYVGNILVDYLAPVIPFLFTGDIGQVMAFAIPGTVAFLAYMKFGKKV